MTKGDRLRVFREHLGLNQTEFANSIDTSQAHLSSMEGGNRAISVAVTFKVAEKWHQLNLDWLHHGRGEMLFKRLSKPTQIDTPIPKFTHLSEVSEGEIPYGNGLILVTTFDNYYVFRKSDK